MKNFMNYNFDISKANIACFVPAGKGCPVHKNRDCHGLAYQVDGEVYYIFDNQKRIRVRAGDIIYLPKKSNYVVETKVPGDCYAINFNLPHSLRFDPFAISIKNRANVLKYFENSEQLWTNKTMCYENRCMANLYNVIYTMQLEYQNKYLPSTKANLLEPALEYIHSHYSNENIAILHLADLCKISEAYFRKLFQSVYSTSPIKYINALKLSHAKELIESGIYSVSESAQLSGFFDDSYFSREFKKAYGLPPSKWKNGNDIS